MIRGGNMDRPHTGKIVARIKLEPISLTQIGLWLIRAWVGPSCLLAIGMILYTLSLSSHGFVFWLFPLKCLIPIRCVFSFLIDGFEHMLYMKHHLSRGLPHYFVWLPSTQLSLNPTLILFIEKIHGLFPSTLV